MFEIDRRQVLVYAAVAAAVLVIGLVSLKGSAADESVVSGTAASSGGTAGSAESDAPTGFIAGGASRRLVVDVSGAVGRPGVYRLPDGARVIDAIRKAGGAARGADVQGINRAARLADGQQVVVPSRMAAAIAQGSAGGTGAGSAGSAGPVSIGSATAAQLEEIDGIGPVTARKIIEFRDGKGGIGSVEDLDQVSGIGPVTMESLRSALQP